VNRICTVRSFCAPDIRLVAQISSRYVGFDALMAMTLKSMALCVIQREPNISEEHHLHLLGQRVSQ
jgi:hypothetical protein